MHELLSSLNPVNHMIFEKRLNGAVAVIPFEEALHRGLLPLQEQAGATLARWPSGRGRCALYHEENPAKDFFRPEPACSR